METTTAGSVAVASRSGEEAARCGDGKRVVLAILERFDAAGIPYAVIGGFERLTRADADGGDVDCVVPRNAVPGVVASLLCQYATAINVDVVRWDVDAGHYITLASRDCVDRPQLTHLHLHSGFQYAGREFLSADEFLLNRRRQAGVWAPSVDVQFVQRLLKKLLSGTLTRNEGLRLTALYRSEPSLGRKQLSRFWRERDAEFLAGAAMSGDWDAVIARAARLRRSALTGVIARRPLAVLRSAADAGTRRLRGARSLHGVHIVFLGPDGVGKTTLINAIASRLTPLFGGALMPAPAPAVLPWSSRGRPIDRPHALPVRPMYQSIPKAVFWFFFYTFEHYRIIRPAMRDGKLVASHRSLVDALVDSQRYRYGGPRWLLSAVLRALPTSDLLIVLDAPAEVIQSRKQEVAPEETARQCHAYRALAVRYANARLVDASQPVENVAQDAIAVIMRYLTNRTTRRLLGITQS